MPSADLASVLKTYLINLDTSEDRLHVMHGRARSVGLSFQRIPGILGSDLLLDRLEEVDIAAYEKWHGKALNPGEVGCYLSHISALRTFLASGAEFGLILEDDANFPKNFQLLIHSIIANSCCWDVVKLSSFHSGTPVNVTALEAGYHLAVPLSRLNNSNSILYNRVAAKRLVRELLPMRLPFDHAVERAWLYGLRFRSINPVPCDADTGMESEIGYSHQLKFPVYRRLPCFLFRIRTELMRICFGLHEIFKIFVSRHRP